MRRLTYWTAMVLLLATFQIAFAQDAATEKGWTQWRGNDRNGIAKLTWPETLSQERLVRERRIPLGPSYSGPIVIGDRVFVTETENKTNEVVKAFRISDGKELWSTSWKGAMKVPFFAAANGSWIRATPAFDNGRLYVGGMKDVLVCLDSETGEIIWKRDFPADSGSAVPTFGFVSSPLIDGEFLYVQAGGGLQKLNKQNGHTVWSSLQDGGGMSGSAFSSPSLATLAGKRQAVVLTRTKLNGVDLETGEVLWSQDIPAFRGMNIVTPTVFGDGVFLSTYGGTSQFFEITQQGGAFSIVEKWKKPIQGYMTTPVVVDGHAYLRLRNQRFCCFDLSNGEVKWRSKPFGKYASLIAAGEHIMALDERGDLMLLKANPEKFEVIDTRKVGDDSWAHLAATPKRLFIRDLEELLIYKWLPAQAISADK